MWISGYAFKLTLKVLPLQCYDMILGMDWLAQHSPMEVDWNAKWMSFDYQGAKILLQGISPKTVHCELITKKELAALEQQDKLWCILELQAVSTTSSPSMPQEIQEIVDQYSDLFVAPSGLPPKRSSVHTIPLIPGAQPFKLRPYRYNSAQKDEIEKQVQQLLTNGWIQESNSPYASPVLLVKKKTRD